jgi:hypothetical protein
MNPVHKFLPYASKIHSNIIFKSIPRSYELSLPSGLYAFLIPSMRATCLAQIVLLDLITLILSVFREA